MTTSVIAEVFVQLADTLVDDYDVVDFLQQVSARCAEVIDVAATGVLLTDQRGTLRVMAASSEETLLLELLQLQTDEGPCPECFHTGVPIAVPDLRAVADRWPHFVEAAQGVGFTSVYALPLRLRHEVIGALNLFGTTVEPLDADRLRLAQALADVATIGILQARAINRTETLAEQLQRALNSRVVIEQAKGVIAERHTVSMDEAFALLRRTARSGNRKLSELAQAVVEGVEVI